MTAPRIGSLCSGYRGLDMAVESVFGGTTAWVSDVDPGANKILAHHWPQTPNLGHERRGGARDRRPGPQDRSVTAAHASGAGLEVGRVEPHGPELPAAERSDRELAADADGDALRQQPVAKPRRGDTALAELAGAEAPADAASVGRGEGRPEPAGQQGGPSASLGGGSAAADTDGLGGGAAERRLRPGQPDADWGRFTPAVARWEAVTGRRAPGAVDDRNRLSPAFVEWLMGLPAGHVTDVPDLTRTQQLKALGNGVVPQQAEAAIRLLADRAAAEPATRAA